MLKLSKLTDYAAVLLVRLGELEATARDGLATTALLSQTTQIPEPTVAKILKMLAQAGLVASHRGARGGYRLARPLSEIVIPDLISAMDGPISITACVEGGTGCGVQHMCCLSHEWDVVNDAIIRALEAVTLEDMAAASRLRRAGTAAETPVPDHVEI